MDTASAHVYANIRHICMYVCMCIHTYIYIYIYIYICTSQLHTCVCVDTQAQKDTSYVRTYIHTSTHIHIHRMHKSRMRIHTCTHTRTYTDKPRQTRHRHVRYLHNVPRPSCPNFSTYGRGISLRNHSALRVSFLSAEWTSSSPACHHTDSFVMLNSNAISTLISCCMPHIQRHSQATRTYMCAKAMHNSHTCLLTGFLQPQQMQHGCLRPSLVTKDDTSLSVMYSLGRFFRASGCTNSS
jgi:hypothetical protein